MYATYDDYTAAGGTLLCELEDEGEKWLERASWDVDTLTFNRITARGFNNLTEFQQSIVRDVVCQLADFDAENAEMLESALTGYSINGVSAQFGEGWNVAVRGGVAIPQRLYSRLCQTGLCCRRLR